MQFSTLYDLKGNKEVSLDISDLGIYNKNMDVFLRFRVTTYTKLSRSKVKVNDIVSSEDIWNRTFAPVNDFLRSLTLEDQQYVAMTIITMHQEIINFMSANDMTNIAKFSQQLSDTLLQLEQTIDLCAKLTNFVETNIPIGDFSQVGKRAQDVKELTWFRQDVVDLLSIAILCKLMAPIFGVFMGYIRVHMDNHLKETHCAAILNKLFRARYSVLINKLRHYINHTVKAELKEDDTAVFHGNTEFVLSFYIFDSLLTRSFINVDLFSKDGNIMTFVIATVKHAVGTQKTNMRKTPFRIRQPSGAGDGDENKVAQHEIDSLASPKTADTVAIILSTIPRIIRGELNMHTIDIDDYLTWIEFYQAHIIIPTEFNKLLTSMHFGPKIGGAKSIAMLHAPAFSKLNVLLQMIAFSMGYIELGHMLTATPALEAKMVQSAEDEVIKMNYSTSFAYKTCQARYAESPFGAGGKEWDTQIARLVDLLMRSHFIYNTCDEFYTKLELPNLNGQLVHNSENLMSEFCAMIEYILSLEDI